MRSMCSRCWPVAALCVALSGCASTPPSSFYTLSPLVGEGPGETRIGGGLGVGLGPVTFPLFLDRPQLVSRATGNRLAVDELQRWGGTLQDDFLRVWSENLAQLLGSSRILIFPSEVRYPLDFRITAEVLAFEGTAEGEALLKVRWAVLDPDLERLLAARESSYRRALAEPRDGDALTAALSAVLADFSREVASVLGDLPSPGEASRVPAVN